MKNEFRIDTPRLFLRPLESTDRDVFRMFVMDGEMMRYLTGGKPWDESKIDEFYARQARHIDEGGYCMGAVILRENGSMVGVAGIQPQRLAGDDELGWWIAPDFQGQGLASEIGAACLDYGLNTLRRKRIVAIADPENIASTRVMEKIGMRYLDTVSGHSLEARYPDAPVARYVAEVEAAG